VSDLGYVFVRPLDFKPPIIRIGESVTQGRIPGQLLSGILDFRILKFEKMKIFQNL
jgi:hypothetical protein